MALPLFLCSSSSRVSAFTIPSQLARRFARLHFYCGACCAFLFRWAKAFIIATLFGSAAMQALNAACWSLYCELVYYLLYPLLRICFRKFSVAACLFVLVGFINCDYLLPMGHQLSLAVHYLFDVGRMPAGMVDRMPDCRTHR
ncbi:MAG: hypothetical protein WDN48_03845 [Pseudolabrys sp.]